MADFQNQPNVQTTENTPMKKIFVGGLSPETSEQDLQEYFSKFGEVGAIRLKTDPNTGNSKGFAFIVFNSEKSVNDVMSVNEHTIKNKKVDVEKAKVKQGKLFVSGLTSDLTDDVIRNHFSSYGNIVQANFPFDRIKNIRKTFCFITFETEKPVYDIIKNPKHMINNQQVYVKKCMDQQQKNNGYNDNSGFQVGGFNNFDNGRRQFNNNKRTNFGNGGNFNNRSSNNFNRGSYQQGNWQNDSFQNSGMNQGQYQNNRMNQAPYQNNMNQGPYTPFNNESNYQNRNHNSNYSQNNANGGKWKTQRFQRHMPY